jgi:uncharacterized protein YbaR (Trm112 family)
MRMQEYLVDMLCCPVCHEELGWSVEKKLDDHVEVGVAACEGCGASYPIRDGIGLFLTDELEREDLWEEVDSALTQNLREHTELDAQLMEVPLEALGPADQLFRAMILEERGDFAGAELAEDRAHEGLYTQDYLRCWGSQVDTVIDAVKDSNNPIVDLASGRCYLVGKLIRQTNAPIIASDFSPRVLKRNRRWLQFKGYYDRVSLLAFDARKTPFRDKSVETMTTNLGVPNIRGTGDLFIELRRILTGSFFAISHFFPEDDGNREVIEQFELGDAVYKARLVEKMSVAGFEVDTGVSCFGDASPTPVGVVLEGMPVDGLPVESTEYEWCVIEGK